MGVNRETILYVLPYAHLYTGIPGVPSRQGEVVIPLFRQLHHVCVVVSDLDKAVAYYESLGVGPWYDYPKGTAYVEYEVPNAEASAAMRYKCADLDNVQLQLCQPPAAPDSPQRRFLEE
ncbi:MAG: hypothetical protein HOY71_39840, partial [Nonomuraea sp.]|nr:hypothetical protein [Nonomuraea sp.]